MSEINYPLQRALDSQQAARAFAAQALNSLFLVNGGALVALLALAGAYAGGGSAVPQGLTAGGYPFAIGLSLAVGSAVVAYATQFSLSSYRESQAGGAPSTAWRRISLGLGIFTLVLMIASLAYAMHGFRTVGAVFETLPAISGQASSARVADATSG